MTHLPPQPLPPPDAFRTPYSDTDLRPSGEEGDSSPARAEPSVYIEILWCPVHKGMRGNDVADGWAKQAASEWDDHRVEWLTLANGDGYARGQPP